MSEPVKKDGRGRPQVELAHDAPLWCKNIRHLRSLLGISQAQVAEKIGKSAAVYSSYERAAAEPGIEEIIAIASFYGVTVDRILREDLSAA